MDFRRLNGKAPDNVPRRQVWCYTRGHWSQVDCPVDDSEGDLDELLWEAGYQTFLGWAEAGSIELAAHAAPGRRHYLIVLAGPLIYEVLLAADLPSLLQLLPPLVRMAKDAALLDRLEAEAEAQQAAARRR
jgi:hypothetical protein